MNIIGIGTDIEKIDRFRKIDQIEHNNFLNKVYNKFEIDYCFQLVETSEELTKIFCGKEAIIKALSNLGYNNIHRNKIGIISNNSTEYNAILPYKGLNVKLDISSSGYNVIAYTIIFKS